MSILSFDLALSLRRLKPHKHVSPFVRRPDEDLVFSGESVTQSAGLLLDTTVYIDPLQGRLPLHIKELVGTRHANHSSVAVAELCYAFGRLDPAHGATKETLSKITETIVTLPPRRLTSPSPQVMAEAAIVAGTIARLRGVAKSDRQLLLNDAILFLQALENGWWLVTRNIADFDAISQLVPAGRVLFYRQSA